MATRTPPTWFVRKLRAIDKAFIVEWSDRKNRWIISEGVPWSVRVVPGVYSTYNRPHRLFYAAELGSHVLDWVRRSLCRRFQSVEQMVKELEIDTNNGHRGPISVLA